MEKSNATKYITLIDYANNEIEHIHFYGDEPDLEQIKLAHPDMHLIDYEA